MVNVISKESLMTNGKFALDISSDEQFVDIARHAVWGFIQHRSYSKKDGSEIERKDLKPVWFNYTAGYWKALIAVMNTGRYYEVTYIQREDQIILDEYTQTDHIQLTPKR